jgi:hypothetical protein
MCVSCGCKKYDDDHGDQRNITMSDLRGASEAAGVGMNDVARNIDEAITGSVSAAGYSRTGMQGGADRDLPSGDTMSHGNTPTP